MDYRAAYYYLFKVMTLVQDKLTNTQITKDGSVITVPRVVTQEEIMEVVGLMRKAQVATEEMYIESGEDEEDD